MAQEDIDGMAYRSALKQSGARVVPRVQDRRSLKAAQLASVVRAITLVI
jgi:hypothetical protein